jgi:hypothetical protein
MSRALTAFRGRRGSPRTIQVPEIANNAHDAAFGTVFAKGPRA